MRQATILFFFFCLAALAFCAAATQDGRCSSEEEVAESNLAVFDRYASGKCTNTMAWMRRNHVTVNECSYHWVVSKGTANAGTVQMGVESSRKPDGFVVLSEYRIVLQGGAGQVKRSDLSIIYNEAMQICFFLNNEFDHVGCPVGILVGHQREDLMIIETLSTFPPPEGWADMLLDTLIGWMDRATDGIRSYRSDVTSLDLAEA